MSFFDALMNFLSSLFGGDKPAQTAEQQKPQTYPVKTTEATLDEMLGFTHEYGKRDEIWKGIVEHESKGEYYYSVYTDKWEYKMRNTLWTVNPIGPKV